MKYAFLLFSLLLFACAERTSTVHQFLPDRAKLEDGLVYKYYTTTKIPNSKTLTNLEYQKHQLSEDTLTIDYFFPDFTRYRRQKIVLHDGIWRIVQEQHRREDEDFSISMTDYQITGDTLIDWVEGIGNSERTFFDKEYTFSIKSSQFQISDSTNNGDVFKVADYQIFRSYVPKEGESQNMDPQSRVVHKENIGIWEIFSSREEIQYHTILDEIMTTSEFEKRQQHGVHRVAYIDSTQVMDQTNDFSTCFPYENINDYYNGDDAGMIGGKGAVWKLVSELDRSSFAGNETGYLTSRFIINCNGEAGNFLFEEAGLDYNRKAFSPKAKEVIYSMLTGVDKWKPVEIDGERKDAYTYITFKFRDGQIVEILP